MASLSHTVGCNPYDKQRIAHTNEPDSILQKYTVSDIHNSAGKYHVKNINNMGFGQYGPQHTIVLIIMASCDFGSPRDLTHELQPTYLVNRKQDMDLAEGLEIGGYNMLEPVCTAEPPVHLSKMVLLSLILTRAHMAYPESK